MSDIIITDHAYDKAKERFSFSKPALERVAGKAYREGITHSSSSGNLKKYITKLWFDYKKADNIKIYGEIIFFFSKNILITVYQIPHSLRKLANKIQTT